MAFVERVVILAGGRGTRLAPYTTVLPKPLMPVGDMAIIEIMLRQLRLHGLKRASIAVGYLAELLIAYLGDGTKLGLTIDYSREEKPLGTAGPLKLVAGLDSTFIVMNGDILTTLDYSALVDFHKRRKATATIAVFSRPVRIDLGVVKFDSDGRLVDYIEKPTLHYEVSMGINVLEPKALDFIPADEYFDLPTLMKTLMQAGEPVLGFKHEGYWLDMGRKEDYERAVEDFDRLRADFLGGEPSITRETETR
jgi:NDP-mannose synthase